MPASSTRHAVETGSAPLDSAIASAFGAMAMLFTMLARLDFLVGYRPWRLAELADQPWLPGALRECTQSMLSAQWVRRLPLLQTQAPAELAADLLVGVLEYVDSLSDTELTVVDFCSGSGGPVPLIEKRVNDWRRARDLRAMQFVLTDLRPNLDDWMVLSQRSANLSFFPNPVDATNPPLSATNHDAKANMDFSSYTRVFRLYCLSFHHFDDAAAVKTLESALKTSDGFAIIELQDRRLSSLVLMILEYFLLFLITAIYFPRRRVHLIFTYIMPVLPYIHAWDGLVSALRTRTFNEVLSLVDVAGGKPFLTQHNTKALKRQGQTVLRADRGEWTFEGGCVRHTYPIGRMNYFVAFKTKKG